MKYIAYAKTFFISGHLDLTQAEFDEHYKHRIDEVVEKYTDKDKNVYVEFVVGDARGTDSTR